MRKINDNLIARLLNGDLAPLLNYVKSDNELRVEVRPNGEAFVYYRKGKALEIGSLKVDKKYGSVPSTQLAISDPPLYFKLMKHSIDSWLKKDKARAEFDTQQNIAKWNQDEDDKYIIIDMEYAFERSKIGIFDREKRAVFDLLGIDRETNRVVLFEIKRGLKAANGYSGVVEHVKDFEICINGKNCSIYKNNLFRDVKNIIADKIKLGLITNFIIPNKLNILQPELVFIFHPEDQLETEAFKKILGYRYKLLLVSENDYKLRDRLNDPGIIEFG